MFCSDPEKKSSSPSPYGQGYLTEKQKNSAGAWAFRLQELPQDLITIVRAPSSSPPFYFTPEAETHVDLVK